MQQILTEEQRKRHNERAREIRRDIKEGLYTRITFEEKQRQAREKRAAIREWILEKCSKTGYSTEIVIKDISRDMHITPTDVTHLVRDMKEEGLITTERWQAQQRVRYIYRLTEKGKETIRQ